VPEFQDLLGIRPPQDIDDMARAEDFAGPFDTGEKHLRRDGQIDEGLFLFPRSAVVAHSTTVRNSGFPQLVHLVLHEGDQRGNHNRC